MRNSIALALLVSAVAVPLFATEPNPSKKQAALVEQLITLTGTAKTSHAVLDYFVDQMYKQEVAQADGDPAAIEDAKKDAARLRELMGNLDLMKLQLEISTRIYAKYLTEADLENLVAFYKTPVAQKYIAALPELSREAMQAGAEKLGPQLEAIMRQVREERERRHPWERTMSDIRSLSVAVDAFETDEEKYPQASELKRLVPTYIKELPEKDGWGNAYFYIASDDGKHYRIASAGSDGVFEWDARKISTAEAKEPKYSEHLEDDIINQDGEFVQLPAVTKPHAPRPASASQPDGAAAPAPRP